MDDTVHFDHINISYLKRVSDNRIEVIRNYIDTFSKEAPKYFENLNNEIEQQRHNELMETIHSLKALFNFMGATQSEDILKQMKIILDNGTGSVQLLLLYKNLLSEYQLVLYDLNTYQATFH